MGLTQIGNGIRKADPYDLMGIVKDTTTGRFHVTLWLEHPLPSQGYAHSGSEGPIRLKSKLHHTVGSETFEGALEDLKKIREKILIDDASVWDKPEQLFVQGKFRRRVRQCNDDG